MNKLEHPVDLIRVGSGGKMSLVQEIHPQAHAETKTKAGMLAIDWRLAPAVWVCISMVSLGQRFAFLQQGAQPEESRILEEVSIVI